METVTISILIITTPYFRCVSVITGKIKILRVILTVVFSCTHFLVAMGIHEHPYYMYSISI